MSGSSGLYIFMNGALVVPSQTPDSALHEEINAEFAGSVFGDVEGMERFSIPDLNGKDNIICLSLPEGEGERRGSPPGTGLPPGWKAVPLRQALNKMTGGTMAEGVGTIGRILRSYHISLWRKDSRFCGSCGTPNNDAGNGELARKCPHCGRLEYPRIAPAVITLITNDKNEILLAHNVNFLPAIYSLIAGFNEAGESLEASVAREIKEEVNLDVKDIRYVISQPWPFPNSLMVGFSAHSSGEPRPDGVEIEDARWFTVENLPSLPGNGSVSRYLIDLWIKGLIS